VDYAVDRVGRKASIVVFYFSINVSILIAIFVPKKDDYKVVAFQRVYGIILVCSHREYI
jgi:hypothetical protein